MVLIFIILPFLTFQFRLQKSRWGGSCLTSRLTHQSLPFTHTFIITLIEPIQLNSAVK